MNKDKIISLSELSHREWVEETEIQLKEFYKQQLPLVEKMHTNEVNIAFNEESTQFKINQILDILEKQGFLRTK
jgi:hypothetical protein